MPEGVPRIRLVAVPDSANLVVRGDVLDEGTMREAALRFRRRYDAWGRYGISAFLATSEPEVDTLCERLERFPSIVVFERLALVEHGVEVVPTFRAPHVTLAHSDVEELLARIIACPHAERSNPYHQGW